MAAKPRRGLRGTISSSFPRIAQALRSSKAFSPGPVALLSLALLGAWLAAVCLMAARHEPWGDEVRALTLALEPAHWWQIPQALRNEGHPVLWYLILRFAHDLCGSTAVLKGASVAVAFLAVVLLFWRGPFPLGWKALFAFSFLPLYEYSVLARNYGISMLLAFAFAAAYPLRRSQPYLLALVLSLLANTNVHSMPLAAGFLALWIWDEALSEGTRGALPRLRPLLIPAALVVLCLAGAAATCGPEKDFLPPGVSPLTASSAFSGALKAVLHPGGTFPVLLPFPGVVRDGIVWLMLAGLLRWVPGLLLLFGYDLALQVLFLAVYPGGLRHQGLLLVAAVTLYWMSGEREVGLRRRGPALALERLALFAVFPLILLTHCWLSRGPIALDWERPFSSSRALAAFLAKQPGMEGAILIPEPENLLESLPYYSNARTFLPSEGKFGKRVTYAGVRQQRLSLGDLLDLGSSLSARYKAPVLLVLGRGITIGKGPGESRIGGHGILAWSREEATRFHGATRELASFGGAISGEDYGVYLMVPSEQARGNR
jgi:hypothetical protein